MGPYYELLLVIFYFSPQIAGIVQPNDGRCNLAKIPDNRFGEYEYTRPLVQVGKLFET